MAFTIGDAVSVPSNYCPGCGGPTGTMPGIVRGECTDPHWKLAEEHPGRTTPSSSTTPTTQTAASSTPHKS